MKKKLFLIFLACGISAILIYLLFSVWMVFGMISTNKPKAIKLECIDQYKKAIKDNFSSINNVDIYYRQGHLCLDFTASPEMSLDECKQIVKATSDFIEKDTEAEPLRAMINNQQLSTNIKFDFNSNIYLFQHSYWIQDTPDVEGKNGNKLWYLSINNSESGRIEIK